MTKPNLHNFDTGAIRSSDADHVRYDLIAPVGLRRLAETYAEGAAKYGDANWLKGIPASNLLNHLIRHIELWKAGDTNEDHLAHAAWGLFSIMTFEETRPELIDGVYRVQPHPIPRLTAPPPLPMSPAVPMQIPIPNDPSAAEVLF